MFTLWKSILPTSLLNNDHLLDCSLLGFGFFFFVLVFFLFCWGFSLSFPLIPAFKCHLNLLVQMTSTALMSGNNDVVILNRQMAPQTNHPVKMLKLSTKIAFNMHNIKDAFEILLSFVWLNFFFIKLFLRLHVDMWNEESISKA